MESACVGVLSITGLRLCVPFKCSAFRVYFHNLYKQFRCHVSCG